MQLFEIVCWNKCAYRILIEFFFVVYDASPDKHDTLENISA